MNELEILTNKIKSVFELENKISKEGYIEDCERRDYEKLIYEVTTGTAWDEVNFEVVENDHDQWWQNTYYSKTLNKTIIINLDEPSDYMHPQDLAEFIIATANEAKKLEEKLSTLNK